MHRTFFSGLTAIALGLAAGSAAAQAGMPGAKDVVLASLAPANQAGANTAARPDAMVVSVLIDGPYGALVPRGVDTPFANGERFRIKLLAPRDGEVLLYNTTPLGRTSPTPIWRTTVRAGLETVSELLQSDGDQGEDLLHVVLQPRTPEADPFAWFQRLRGGAANTKDIRLVSETTAASTYFYNPHGQGGYVTIRIRH